jgi:hypothetical protein
MYAAVEVWTCYQPLTRKIFLHYKQKDFFDKILLVFKIKYYCIIFHYMSQVNGKYI